MGLRDGQKDMQAEDDSDAQRNVNTEQEKYSKPNIFSGEKNHTHMHTRGRVQPHCEHNRFTALQVDELQAELCTRARHG